VEPVQIKRDDRCPVCGKPLLDEEEEDEDGAENEDRDETEALVEDNITPMFESFKRQSEETMNLMKEKIEGGVDELKQESLTLMEDMLKATGKSIGGLSADIAGLREEMSSLKTRGSGFSIGNIFAIIMSLAAIVSVAAFYFMGEGPR
jgi:DNA repair exonuclease SbcCD ATPase subunit